MGYKATARNVLLHALLGEHFIARGPRAARELMLTFDDGPDPQHTPAFLDLLHRHGAPATFFVTGEQAHRHPELLARIVAAGHALGNHGYSHERFADQALADQQAQIERTNALLAAQDGRDRHWFRPPHGRLTWGMVTMLRRMGQPLALWSHDSLDYRKGTAAAIVARFAATPAKAGDVVLFHDDNAQTLAALETLIPQWRAQGFAFGAIAR